MLRTPLEDLWYYTRDHGLYGLTVAGATTPTALNGDYVCHVPLSPNFGLALINGQPSWEVGEGGYRLSWSTANSAWQLAANGSATVLFRRVNASPVGLYAAVTGTGNVTVAAEPTCLHERRYGGGEVAQTVYAAYGQAQDTDAARYARYGVQIACYGFDEALLNRQAQALADYFNSFADRSTAAPGLALRDWRAEQVQATCQGVIAGFSVTSGTLYKSVTNLQLINVSRSTRP